MQPIWKDYYFTIPLASAEYRIQADGETIYTGKAYARPNETTCKVKVNEICADYMRSTLPVIGRAYAGDFTDTFSLDYLNGVTWTTAGSVQFSWDWSYDATIVASNGYSFPIKKKLSSRQLLAVTSSANSLTATATKTSGTTKTLTGVKHSPATFGTTESIFCQTPMGAFIFDLSDETDIKSVSVDGKVYTVDGCPQYVLYYVNEVGGWDSLLIEGRVSRTDAYARHNSKNEYDNTQTVNAGERNHLNEVTRILSLRTGWLTDEGAERMHNLIGSTLVYLHDTISGELKPIIIDDAECEYKSSRYEDGIVSYAIQAHIAGQEARR